MDPPSLGFYTVSTPPLCEYSKMTNDVRRRDVPPPLWSLEHSKKVPDVSFLEPTDNVAGLPTEDRRPRSVHATEQGPISLGTGPSLARSFMPSVGDLRRAPYMDTRRTAISDRYYR